MSAIVALGHNLRLKVIAEGVEAEAQLHLLRSLGADEFQGYLRSRPLPPCDFERFLAGLTAFTHMKRPDAEPLRGLAGADAHA